jgi:anaerobic selenocysteine-containing dehydrogenase
VWNEAGELSMRIAVSDKTPPGVGWAPKGRWPGKSPSGLNVNALNSGLRSDMGESTALHGVEVQVEADG